MWGRMASRMASCGRLAIGPGGRVVSAASLRRALELRGVAVWTDSRELTSGDLLPPAVQAAIKNAPHFVVLLSPNARGSKWVMKEVRYALEVRKKRTDGYKVIPILLDGFELTELELWFPEEPVAERIGGVFSTSGDT